MLQLLLYADRTMEEKMIMQKSTTMKAVFLLCGQLYMDIYVYDVANLYGM